MEQELHNEIQRYQSRRAVIIIRMHLTGSTISLRRIQVPSGLLNILEERNCFGTYAL